MRPFEVRVLDQYSQRWHHPQLKSAEPLCAYFPFARHRREILSYNIQPTSTSRSIQRTYGKRHLLYEPFLQEVKVQLRTASATWLLPFTLRMAVNLAGALTFCWFLPQQKEQCKDWAEECQMPWDIWGGTRTQREALSRICFEFRTSRLWGSDC